MSLAPIIMSIKPKRLRNFAVRMAGRLRVHKGTLPDFIIIGAQKAGTTSLYGYIQEHPDVLPCAWKEVQFFHGKRYARGVDWYKRQFLDPGDLRSSPRFGDRQLASGEATPYYLFHPHVPERIRSQIPNVRLIALLRDPVARAYSQYQHNVRKGKESLSFADALKREDEVLPIEHARMLADTNYRSEAYHRFSYKFRGHYADHLERYLRFFRREQLLIVKSEDLFEKPEETYDQVIQFLGLASHELKSAEARNAGGYERQAIPQEEELHRYFRSHNRRLYNLIDRDMGW
jgi:hypothetical protein